MVIVIISEVITAIAAIAAGFFSWRNHDKLSRVEVNIDGRMDRFIQQVSELKQDIAYEKTQPAEEK